MIYPLPEEQEQDFTHGGHFGDTPKVEKPFFTVQQMRAYSEQLERRNKIEKENK